MKRFFCILGVLVLCGNCVYAQKEDYQWLLGYINSAHVVSDTAGGCKLDFNYSPADTSLAIRLADFDGCNVSYCDKNGNIMFYSNCADVFDSRDSVMENGDTINHGEFWNAWHSSNRYHGMPMVQGILALPGSKDSTQYFLFHFPLRFCNLPSGINTYITDTMYSTEIDMKGNFGYGNVVAKDVPITTDSLYGSVMSAVKHGNGKYWWIIKPYYIGKKYYKFLLDETGIHLHDIQSIGGYHTGWGNLGYSCFSNDGEKYFRVNATDGVWMFDFDRCTGQMSSPIHILYPFPTDSVVLVAGVAVSPNDRYLYVSCTGFVLQYDLQANPIESVVDTVEFVDVYADPYPTQFFMEQLGPDGKIYLNHPNTVRTLHVINLPNEPGTNCYFVKNGIPLPTLNAFSLPNFPNYRLGPLTGSSCDTLTDLNDEAKAEKEKILKVFPNPTTDFVVVDYGFTD